MSKKIFKSIWTVALAVFLASLIFIMGVMHTYVSDVQKEKLQIELQLAAKGVSLKGLDYFKDLKENDERITWIAADGSVLYDNEVNSADMGNHIEREEVIEARRDGIGESSRYSDTLSEKLLYCAKKLPDGTVLRLASSQNTIWTLLLGFAQPICFVIMLALILSFLLASRLSKKIVEPINNLDLDSPADYLDKAGYKEIEPLLRRMASQQSEIKNNQAELEKTSQIRQEFTANASHELKTPLHAISGYAELLESGMVKKDDLKPFAGKIRQEAQRMTKLVDDIIDLTKLDGGLKGLQREETDLKRIAENAVDSLQSAADARGITISLTGETAPLNGIPQVLYSIVYNLCDNAIKYNMPDGTVRIEIKSLRDSVKLIVSDTGTGIPSEYKERIFERFYRVDNSRSKEVGGTGLGLSIVKHGAIIHHAKILTKSEVGKGTTFTVIFPKN